MKSISKAALRGSWLAVCALLLFTAPAAAQDGSVPLDNGLYLEATGGTTRSLDQDASFETGLASLSGDIDYKTGWMVGGAVGVRINQIRFELAGQYRNAQVEEVTLNDVIIRTTGDVDVISGFANVLYDFTFEDFPIRPYLGGGIGVVNFDFDVQRRTNQFLADDDANEFAWNLLLGIGVPLSESLELLLNYRHLAIFDEVSVRSSFPGVVSGDLEMDYSTNEFGLGLRYTF